MKHGILDFNQKYLQLNRFRTLNYLQFFEIHYIFSRFIETFETDAKMHDYFENEKAPYFMRNLEGLHDEDKLRVVVERLKKDMCQRSLTKLFAKKHIKNFLVC